ncbi:MAG: glycosyltransferase family 4 protein, partial [Desulfovibrio sp.]|nr:glycosyltransferase family 4 protein [Desulfovibrio sp.]
FLDYYPEENPDQIRVAHHGGGEHFTPASPEDAATARRRCDIPEGVPFILCLTTLEPRKGLEHTIRAFIALLGSFPSPAPHLVIVGRKGWRYSPILKAARNCADEIHFTGFLPDATVRGLLTACDCFVFMSRYEGFGLPLVEAMACGAAVIASNATVIPEIVGDAALLLPPQDVDALAESMRLLCADSALRSKLRKAALQRAKHFTWEKCAETMVQSMRSSIGTQAEKCNETTR